MKISMLAEFRLLRNMGNGEYAPITDNEIEYISPGGYSFDIGDKTVPFDWTAYSGEFVKDGSVFSFETGYGFHKDFELDECFDEDYERLGIVREDITAQFLASTHNIADFYVSFDADFGNGLEEDCGIGVNTEKDAEFKIEILNLSFEDINTGKRYDVDSRVIEAFNKGEKLASLENIISNAKQFCEDVSKGEIKAFDNSEKDINEQEL